MFLSSFDRPNIRYAVVPKASPKTQLLTFLKAHQGESGIVYCLSRKTVEETATMLQAAGIRALPYHAKLDSDMRSRHQDAFLAEEGLVLVATVAFGMGIDKPDVRFVVHVDLPGSLEAFYQETGRAGRDGLPSETLLLYGTQDIVFRRQMINDTSAPEEIKRVENIKLNALLGVCETADCRRQAILAHFGEVMAQPCGNCDTCMTPPETWDATTACRKALSAILRTGHKFGTAHLVDILLGAKTEKIERFNHDKLPTFGVGTELDRKGWTSVYRQLMVRGVVEVDHESFGALRLMAIADPILRGAETVLLRRDQSATASSTVLKKKTERIALDGGASALFELLRSERARLAREQNVPAYIIFHDTTLAAIATAKPKSLDELGEIPGIGRTKVERYGETVLAAVRTAK
jgi:ATP-dependent DNA helicase RecQ